MLDPLVTLVRRMKSRYQPHMTAYDYRKRLNKLNKMYSNTNSITSVVVELHHCQQVSPFTNMV